MSRPGRGRGGLAGREAVVAAVLGFLALVGTAVAAAGTPDGPADQFAFAGEIPVPTTTSAEVATVPAVEPAPTPEPTAEPTVSVVLQPPATAEPTAPVAGAVNPLDAVTSVVPRAAAQWVATVSSATGISPRAMQAYGDATLVLAAEDPGCRLGWTILAGIGQIESGHGRSLGDDGRPSSPIVGPALDGSPGRAAIRATAESTAWHGDPSWDHAVGPMQFIPSTWRTWAADGDGDGVADPQDIDDAALAAARYLCAGSRDLSTGEGWRAAVLSYNHSDAYVDAVLAAASRYATAAGV